MSLLSLRPCAYWFQGNWKSAQQAEYVAQNDGDKVCSQQAGLDMCSQAAYYSNENGGEIIIPCGQNINISLPAMPGLF